MDNKRSALTRTIIEGAQPQSKPYRLWDLRVPGLFMRVQPSGAKTWNVQWSRASSKSLGRHPVVTLDAARRQALAVLGDAAVHGTPEAARKRPKDMSLRAFLAGEYLPWAHGQHKAAEGSFRRIQNAFPDLLAQPLRQITGFLIEKARTKRLAGGLSSSTCNRDFASLRSVMSKAVSWGFLDENPFGTVKVAKVDNVGVVRFLDRGEEARLRAALQQRDADIRAARESGNSWRAERGKQLMPRIEGEGFGDHLSPLVLLAINTGLRRGELTSLTWSDIDLAAKRLIVRAGYAKSGKARHLPLNSEAVRVLETWRGGTDQEGLVLNVADPKKAWAGLLEAAKIENFRFHDLRHHFASRLVMAGVDLNTVRELLGHADLKMTLRYAHLAPEHKAEAVERLVAVTVTSEGRTQGQH